MVECGRVRVMASTVYVKVVYHALSLSSTTQMSV